MLDIILSDLWDSLDLLITCVIVTGTIILNTFIAFRIMFMVQNYQDPINAFKKESNPIEDVFKNNEEYKKINAV
jgi:hypothetical protein